ncbi:hypothetical protein [Qipengyuania marisflavi]|uniref:Uncharacterized protein n=1 Tax=Qipengyuania marisflavi TaxID=2486356 RepID=A0A5S3PDY3_9SPHN|nr:hypothetical protein [Qipengyuania marisflavi]TMM49760.1 hypothetical protein FEV51_00735 [Qipengyuania marisflavi]
MTEERITETTTDTGDTHTTRTVITDGEPRSGGGGSWIWMLLLLVAVVAGIYFFSQMSDAEVAKDNAVTEAAGQVGEAANQVGEAAQNAGDAVQDAVTE